MTIAEKTHGIMKVSNLEFLRKVRNNTPSTPLEEAVKKMKGAQMSVERRILNELSGVENITAEENKELRTIVRLAFDRFAFDPHFQKMYSEQIKTGRSTVMESLKGLKTIYYNKISSSEDSILTSKVFTTTMTQHMKDLAAILDPRLDAASFNERARELGGNLELSGRTEISDKIRYEFLTEEIKKKEEMKKRASFAAKERWDKYFHRGKYSLKVNETSSVSTSCMGTLDYIRNGADLDYVKATPDFNLCMTNPNASKDIPEIKTALKGYEVSGLDEKLSTIYSQNKSVSYTYFINDFNRATSAKNAVIQKVIDNYASKTGKKPIKFGITDMNSSNWRTLASYYQIEQHVGNFVLKLKEDYAKSLIGMINQTYEELRRTPGIQN